jgi:hypothetical protein
VHRRTIARVPVCSPPRRGQRRPGRGRQGRCRLPGRRPGARPRLHQRRSRLFLAPYLDRREVAAVGSVRQDFQDPFAELSRARDEEFGEVIGEGLIAWLHTGSLHSPLSEKYWAEFLRLRAAFIETVALGCRLSDHPDAARAGVALEIAESARRGLSPRVLADYVAAWWADRDSWRRFLTQLDAGDGLVAALDRLGLPADYVGPSCTTPWAGSS